MPAPNTLGIDFGTSNSAVGIAVNGKPWLIEVEPGQTTLPTAVFFDPASRSMRVGRRATDALITGEEGRFMRALKSLLGTPLLREKRRIHGEELTFVDIIARFLAHLKTQAETATHHRFTHALSGRPVVFHSKDPARNAQAEIDLKDCYLKAGFEDVRFLFEPEAALRSTAPEPGLGLIVDIGGGTSDYTVFRPVGTETPQVLTSHGIRLGGTDFDRQLSLEYVMPLLGRGSRIRNTFGADSLPTPNRIYNDLATWQMIPFLYTQENRRLAREMAQSAEEPEKLNRLVNVLEDMLGHDLAFAVERGKIHANQPDHPNPQINLSILERGLSVPMRAAELNKALSALVEEILHHAALTLEQVNLRPETVDRIVLVGGSSLLGTIEAGMQQLCPNARIHKSNAMTAVADGLALAAETAFA
ncbi:MAG: Hsp70 family protein [Rhodobacteraceae bacterium]|nr:Hsp70 family protein [Paracoccaceae bacterium]